MKYCVKCGATAEEAGPLGFIEVIDYTWESGRDTALSIPVVVGYICKDALGCAKRNIRYANSSRALREVVADTENYSEDIRKQAQAVLREMSETAQMIARGEDAVAREGG